MTKDLAEQMELPLGLNLKCTATPGMKMSRRPDGQIVIQPTATVELIGSTEDAGKILRRSSRHVRNLFFAGELRGTQLKPGGKIEIDLVHCHEIRAESSNY